MEQLYQQAVRTLTESQKLVQELLSGMSPNETVLESRIWDGLQQLEQDCHRLQILAQKLPPTQRQEAKYRVDQFKADFQAVQSAYQSHQQRKSAAEQELKQREELLSRRFTPNSEGDASITIDPSLQQNQRMTDAHRGMDDLIGHGAAVLDNLRGQGFTLKGAHKKLLDISNTLGLSTTVMRLIEKRAIQDKWLFWSGIAITSTIILLLVYYFVL